ncbi:ubiquitin--protein ligase [Onchocerca flexuosa]|uniref:Ubiquitin--protein ligase n=1 Tax=Onchocerca flexuosa TaxID=387005 RepID=A0A238BTH5_9BILA|nr:ubiquitin--protein ligase [Onchocerca flexuosa]
MYKNVINLIAELKRVPVDGFSAGLQGDDIYKWEVLVIGPPDTLYEGGFFKALLEFPKEYPLLPPKMKFISEIWHPNMAVCSIKMLVPIPGNREFHTNQKKTLIVK